LTVIPSGVDVDAFRGAIGSSEVKRRWGIASGDIVIGTVAAFEIEKGHETLVRAAADILREVSHARFILVGEGRLKGRIEGEIRRAGLAGRLACVPLDTPLEQMLPLFDIFVLPSLEEGLSTALIAAMAAGLAVVASMTGGIPDVVSAGTGILVPPGDHEALSRAIVTLIRDERLRRSMGDAGAKRAADFSIGLTVERTLGIYRNLIEKGRMTIPGGA
jgi:glycosyltransferase involved in cell wall biosynthesis